MALKRAQTLDRSLQQNAEKAKHFQTFMSKVISSGAAEVAPPANKQECWYLPLFGVYNSKKPGQKRGVFDSSAVYQGVSLNDVLMSNPDMTNSLLGILMRFRKNAVAVSADVKQMFYRFKVHPDHRDFLRFFWYKNNDLNSSLIEYRMTVHVFGNCASPAIATLGLQKAVHTADDEVKDFVARDFYVDDALTFKPTAQQAITLLKITQKTLADGGNVRLHKVASNSLEVLKAFPAEDLGGILKLLISMRTAYQLKGA